MTWYYAIEVISAQILIYYVLCKLCTGRICKLFVFCPIINILSALLYSHNYSETIFAVLNIVLCYLLPVIFVKNINIKSKLFLGLITLGIYYTICEFILFLFYILDLKSMLIIGNFIHILITIIVIATSFHKKCNKKIPETLYKFLSVNKQIKCIIVIFIWSIFLFLNRLKSFLFNNNISAFVVLCFSLLLFAAASFIILYFLITLAINNSYYKKLNKDLEKSINNQIQYSTNLYNTNESLKKFHHDFNNLTIGLYTLLKENDISGALQYLNNCCESVNTDYILYNSGHPVLNALISAKAFQTKDNNIIIKINGSIPKNSLNPAEICTVFGNALDNAIEACLKLQDDIQKNIIITICKKSNYLFIEITNPTAKNLIIKNNTIFTTKNNNGMHGIGLYSIKNVVKKYEGHMSISCINNIFKIKIDFQLFSK